MANLDVVTAYWSGGPGLPGTSTFYLVPGTHDLTGIHDFFGANLGRIPTGISIDVRPEGQTIDAANGNLVGGWSASAVSVLHGSGTTLYAGGVGACVRWNTGTVVDGRTVKGHTYLVPMLSSIFDTNGSLNDSDGVGISATATSLVTAYPTSLSIWHRPKKDKVTHAVTRAGSAVLVTSGFCLDRAAILRSRRN